MASLRARVDVIATAPQERFVDIYNKYYRPERVTFVMVGDFKAADIEAKIKDKFADWQGVGEEGGDPELGPIEMDRGLQANFFYDPDVPTVIPASGFESKDKEDSKRVVVGDISCGKSGEYRDQTKAK